MQNKGLCIPDVGQVAGKFYRVDEFFGRSLAAFNAKAENCPESIPEIKCGSGIPLMTVQPGVIDPFSAWMFLQPLRKEEGVFALLADTKGQCFKSLQEEEGIEGTGAQADVPHSLNPCLDYERHVAHPRHVFQGVPVNQAVIAGVW